MSFTWLTEVVRISETARGYRQGVEVALLCSIQALNTVPGASPGGRKENNGTGNVVREDRAAQTGINCYTAIQRSRVVLLRKTLPLIPKPGFRLCK